MDRLHVTPLKGKIPKLQSRMDAFNDQECLVMGLEC